MLLDGTRARTEATLLMKAYNDAFAEVFDTCLESISAGESGNSPLDDERIRTCVLNDLDEWFTKPLALLDGHTPGQAIESLDTLEKTLTYFETAAILCDDSVPDRVKAKLASFGTAAADALMTMALKDSWKAGTDTDVRSDALLAAVGAIVTLGEWGVKDALELLTAKFESLEEPDENVAEAFRSYCTHIGPEAARVLAQSVERAARGGSKGLTGPFEYMIIAIADIGKDHRDERLFQCLRTAFRSMERKAVGAICLGDYGDGRAVSTLKGFLDRFEGQVDRQTFYEVTNAIRRLGGDLSDVRNPFASDGGRPS